MQPCIVTCFSLGFFLCKCYIFLKCVGKAKFKELLNSLSWALMVVPLLLIHLAGEELGKVFIEETCTVGGQFITTCTLPSRTTSLGNECRKGTQWLPWLCSVVAAESSPAGVVFAPFLPGSCSWIALGSLAPGYSGFQERWLFFGTIVAMVWDLWKGNTGL